jgi:hypothetical protein
MAAIEAKWQRPKALIIDETWEQSMAARDVNKDLLLDKAGLFPIPPLNQMFDGFLEPNEPDILQHQNKTESTEVIFDSPVRHRSVELETYPNIKQKRIELQNNMRNTDPITRGLKRGDGVKTQLFNKQKNYLIAHDSNFMDKYKDKNTPWTPREKEDI